MALNLLLTQHSNHSKLDGSYKTGGRSRRLAPRRRGVCIKHPGETPELGFKGTGVCECRRGYGAALARGGVGLSHAGGIFFIRLSSAVGRC